MKLQKYVFAVAILGTLAFTSCTPNSLDDDTNGQQIERSKIIIPTHG